MTDTWLNISLECRIIYKKIIDLIEVKLSDDEPSTALKYYREKLHPQNTVQILGDLKHSFNAQ